MRLSELVRVQPGYLSRDRVRYARDGSHRLLRGRDVSDDQGVRADGAIRFHPKRRVDLYRVRRGDILVTARGQNHRAYHIDQDLSDVLAAATFYILRPDTSRIRPGYLAWWLNLPRVQSLIEAASGGTYISHIRRGALERLVVSVPLLRTNTGSSRSCSSVAGAKPCRRESTGSTKCTSERSANGPSENRRRQDP